MDYAYWEAIVSCGGLVINQFPRDGIHLPAYGLGGNEILGNIIGLSPENEIAKGNGRSGIEVNSSSNNVGLGDANLVCANQGDGISIRGANATENIVQGNRIGLNAAGQPRGNGTSPDFQAHGIRIGSLASTNFVVGNIIGGHPDGGLSLDNGAFGNIVIENWIGLDPIDQTPAGNGNTGIVIQSNAHDNHIASNQIKFNQGTGVLVAGSPDTSTNIVGDNVIESNDWVGVAILAGNGNQVLENEIRKNGAQGVLIGSGTGHTIHGNSIHDNGQLGIDLGIIGMDSNDADDSDEGPNQLQNFPEIIATSSDENSICMVSARLNSIPNEQFNLEFFANETADPSGHGEREVLLGSTELLTAADGTGVINTSFWRAVPSGHTITATATDSQGNTSEFSQAQVVTITSLDSLIIQQGPQRQELAEGQTAILSVSVLGQAPLNYQWRKEQRSWVNGQWVSDYVILADGDRISGASSAILTLSDVLPEDSDYYSVTVSNVYGEVTSERVYVQIVSQPVITQEPLDMAVLQGLDAELLVLATGFPSEFQWFRNGEPIPGATQSRLLLTSVDATMAGDYQVRIRNIAGEVFSRIAHLDALSGPDNIAFQPRGSDANVPRGPGYGGGIAIRDGLTYAATGAGRALVIYDVGDPDNPAALSQLDFDASAFDVDLVDHYALVTLRDAHGLAIIDVSNPAEPIHIKSLPLPLLTWSANSIFVRGNLAFIGAEDTGLQILDIRDPLNPLFIGAADTAGNANGVHVEGNMAYVADWHQGAALVDISNLTEPVVHTQISRYWEGGSSTSALDCFHQDGFLYVADGGQGLVILDVRDQDSPEFIGSFGSSYTSDVEVSGRVAFVANELGGLDIYDITDPTKVIPMGTFSEWGGINAVKLVGNRLYVLGSRFGIVDLTLPGHAPRIMHQQIDPNGVEGESTQFEVNPSGSEPFTFEWRLNGNPIAGVSGNTLFIESIAPEDAGFYSVRVSNDAGSILHSLGELSVGQAPKVSGNPESQAAVSGSDVILQVGATGTEPLTYQWLFEGQVIDGATESTLDLGTVNDAQAGTYTVRVSNAIGAVTSDPALLTVVSAPTILEQPLSQELTPGEPLQLQVMAAGTEPLSYQWRCNGNDIIGATSTDFLIANFQPSDGGSYSAVVSNAYGVSESKIAIIRPAIPELPLSDFFADSGFIDTLAGVGLASNIDATREPDEPYHGRKIERFLSLDTMAERFSWYCDT